MRKIPCVLVSALAGVLLAFAVHAAGREEEVAWLVVLKPICDQGIDGFAEKSKEPYARMRQQYADLFATYEASREVDSLPRSSPVTGDLEQLQSTCEGILDFLLNDGQPPDPRLATPRQTWDLFLSALRSGDRATLAICLSPGERSNFDSLSTKDLAELASTLKSFDLLAASGESFQSAVVQRSDGIAGMVLFAKSARGWRIAQF